jgi:hypothetical protein
MNYQYVIEFVISDTGNNFFPFERWMQLKNGVFLIIGHMKKKIVRLLELRFWFVIVLLASEILI